MGIERENWLPMTLPERNSNIHTSIITRADRAGRTSDSCSCRRPPRQTCTGSGACTMRTTCCCRRHSNPMSQLGLGPRNTTRDQTAISALPLRGHPQLTALPISPNSELSKSQSFFKIVRSTAAMGVRTRRWHPQVLSLPPRPTFRMRCPSAIDGEHTISTLSHQDVP